MRVRLVVAYDGTNYHGWQIQNNAISVEEVLQEALRELLREPVELIGASRTDAGVHAQGNVAVFDTDTRIPAEKIAIAVNQRLPEDIRVMKSEQVEETFHPRYAVSEKTYEYRISNVPIQLPTERLYSYFVYLPLDIEKMHKAAQLFIGEHDFAGFCSAKSQVQTTVRTIYRCEVEKMGHQICIRVTGSGFLYNMVRAITGTVLYAAEGKFAPEDIPAILERGDRSAAGPTVPPGGLYLTRLWYEDGRLNA